MDFSIRKLFALMFLLLVALPADAGDFRDLQFQGNYDLINAEGGTTAFNNFVLNSSDDGISILTQQPRADTITTICYRHGVETGDTPATVVLSIQTPSSTALGPNGTILGGGSPASVTFDPSAVADGTGECKALANSIALAQGQDIAPTITCGTCDGSNNSSFSTSVNNVVGRQIWPTAVTKTNGAAWVRVSGLPAIWWKSATTTYGWPIETVIASGAVTLATTPDEYGNKFAVFSADTCDTAVVDGMECKFSTLPAANKVIKFSLYSGTTRLRSYDLDSDKIGVSGDSDRTVKVKFNVADSGALTDAQTCGSNYYIAVAPQDASNNVQFTSFEADTAAELVAWVGGTTMFQVTRTDSGAWTETETDRVLLCNPIYGAITEPTGGGAGQKSNLNGGLN